MKSIYLLEIGNRTKNSPWFLLREVGVLVHILGLKNGPRVIMFIYYLPGINNPFLSSLQ